MSLFPPLPTSPWSKSLSWATALKFSLFIHFPIQLTLPGHRTSLRKVRAGTPLRTEAESREGYHLLMELSSVPPPHLQLMQAPQLPSPCPPVHPSGPRPAGFPSGSSSALSHLQLATSSLEPLTPNFFSAATVSSSAAVWGLFSYQHRLHCISISLLLKLLGLGNSL